MKERLNKNNYGFGILIGILTILITALILLLGLLLFSKGAGDDPKLFMFSFIPTLLLMRWYFKTGNIKTAKAIVIVIFIGFMSYFIYLLKMGIFS